MDVKEGNLKKRILEEMTVDHADALEKNFPLAKQYVRITSNGKVDVLFKENLNGKDQILMYLIGKLYAKEAGLAVAGSVGNKELMDELGIPQGSLLPWLKDLRESKIIKQIKKEKYIHHYVPISRVAKILKNIEKKLSKHT